MSNRDHDRDEGHMEVFLEDRDVIREVQLDEEELPDVDDDDTGSEADAEGGLDDSVHLFTGHTGELYSVARSPTDAYLVATGGGDNKGFLWRIGHGDWAFELQGHEESISTLAFSADGKFVASGSFDGNVKVWDTFSNSLKCTLDGPLGGIEWLTWHPKGHIILAGSDDFMVWMWNADVGNRVLNTFSGHGNSVTCGDFTPDGKIICTGSDDATLRIWNPRTAESIHVVRGHTYHTDGLTCLVITSDSSIAITGSKDGSLYMVNISTGMVVSFLAGHTESVECFGLSQSYNWAASGGIDGKLIVWDPQHSTSRCTCHHEEGVTCLTWVGMSKYIATGCVDGKVRIWDSLTGECVKTLHGHSDAVEAMALASNGDHLVSVSMDETARVFDVSEFR